MQKWEYISMTWLDTKIYVGHDLVVDSKEAIPLPYMQQLGQQGWEMVTAVSESASGITRWYFKRPIE